MISYKFVVFNDEDNNINSWVNIGYIASYLEYHKTASVEFGFYKIDEVNRAVREVCAVPVDVIGLPMLQHNFYEVLLFCQQIKKVLPKIFIVLGNKDASCYYRYIMQNCPEVDAVILGEGEVTTSELCRKLSVGESLYDCPGLVVRHKGKIIKTSSRQLIADLDEIPFPSRKYRIGNSNIYNIIGSRGCVGRCSFCESNTIFKNNSFINSPVRCRSISNIIDEVVEVGKNSSFIVVNFLDSTFCSNDKRAIERLEELYKQIIERKLNIQFNINVRSEQVSEKFIDCLGKLSRVGLDSILVGIESGNVDDIRIYNKGGNLDKHINAIKLLNDALQKKPNFIGIEYGFINFNPYSTIEKLEQNADFAIRHNITLYPFDIMSRLRISGSTEITHKLHKEGLLIQDQDKPITNPYAYKYIDARVYELYSLLEKVYAMISFPNISVVLSKLRRFSLHEELNPYVLQRALAMKESIGNATVEIFKQALFVIRNLLPEDEIFKYAREKNNILQKDIIELKKIENRISVNLAKIHELPHFR